MRKAYIVLAHTLPVQLCRLIQRLDDGSSIFYVHIDKASPMAAFGCLSGFGEKVVLVPRENSQWARLGIVQATLNALRSIEGDARGFDRAILLSGQDYPIKSNREIDGFLHASPYRVFMNHWRIPNVDVWRHRGGLARVDKYFFGIGRHQVVAASAANLLARIVPPLRRTMPDGLTPYGGWMWWIFDRAAVRRVLRYVDEHPGYVAYHRHTFAPDEVFFQTLLLNSRDEELIASICNDDMRFVLREGEASHPRVLGKGDLEALMSSQDLFARKFDARVDARVLDAIDAALERRP